MPTTTPLLPQPLRHPPPEFLDLPTALDSDWLLMLQILNSLYYFNSEIDLNATTNRRKMTLQMMLIDTKLRSNGYTRTNLDRI